jgi:hypothetical protein
MSVKVLWTTFNKQLFLQSKPYRKLFLYFSNLTFAFVSVKYHSIGDCFRSEWCRKYFPQLALFLSFGRSAKVKGILCNFDVMVNSSVSFTLYQINRSQLQKVGSNCHLPRLVQTNIDCDIWKIGFDHFNIGTGHQKKPMQKTHKTLARIGA